MSNPLSVRRVHVQTIDEAGNPVGEPTFGVMAADNDGQAYNDTFETRGELETAIEAAPSILAVAANPDDWECANHEVIGRDNYFGKDWVK